ncbi:MAG: hypothetical protein ACK4PR_05840, partial [Gammaproteobacteria bacterium]
MLITEEGKIHAVATHFISEEGTEAFAKGNIELYSLKFKDTKKTKEEKLWGLNKSNKTESHESAEPVLIIDNGVTILESAEGSIIGRGVVALGNGDFVTNAKNGSISFTTDTLKHEYHEEKEGVSISSPAFDKINGFKENGLKGVFSDADPVFGKTEKLLNSSDGAELAANSWNAGIAGYNAYQNMKFALQNDAVFDLVANQTGATAILNPKIDVTYKKESTDIIYETNGPGAIHRGNWTAEAKDQIYVEGMDVDIANNVNFKAREVAINGKELHSEYAHKQESVTVGVSPTGNVTDASVNKTESKGKATTYENASFKVGKNTRIEADALIFSAVDFNTGTLTGEVGVVEATTKQGTYQSKTTSASASSTGQFSFFSNKTKGAKVDKQTTIHVREGINHEEGKEFIVDTTINTGAAITNDGQNNYQSNHMINHEV